MGYPWPYEDDIVHNGEWRCPGCNSIMPEDWDTCDNCGADQDGNVREDD